MNSAMIRRTAGFLPLVILLLAIPAAGAPLPADAFWADGLHHAGIQGTLYVNVRPRASSIAPDPRA